MEDPDEQTFPKHLTRPPGNPTIDHQLRPPPDSDVTNPSTSSSENDVTVPKRVTEVNIFGPIGSFTLTTLNKKDPVYVHSAKRLFIAGTQMNDTTKYNTQSDDAHDASSQQSVSDNTDENSPSSTDHDDDDDDDRRRVQASEELERVVQALTGQGHVLVSSMPGPHRDAFLAALTHHFSKKGYKVDVMVSLEARKDRTERNRKGRERKRKTLVIVDRAFGAVRAEKSQWTFFQNGRHRITRLPNMTLYLVYPHVLNDLRFVTRSVTQSEFQSSGLIPLRQDPVVSVEHYTDLLVAMLADVTHGVQLAKLLALVMQGKSRDFHSPGPLQGCLQETNFTKSAKLRAYTRLLSGVLLTREGTEFISREVHNAAGLALADVFGKDVVLEMCDIDFLVQHVRVEPDASEACLMVDQGSRYRGVLMQRMLQAILTGHVSQVTQHPALQQPQFLQQFEQFCRERDQLRAVVSALDTQSQLPLLYWCMWTPSCCLMDWCLGVMTHLTDTTSLAHLLSAAFAAVLLTQDWDLAPLLTRVGDELAAACSTWDLTSLTLPLPHTHSSHSPHVQHLRDRLSQRVQEGGLLYLGDPSLPIPHHLVTVTLVGDVIRVRLPCQQPYLALRAVSDRQMGETDRQGNTLLHVATQLGQVSAISLSVRSGQSVLTKNKAGQTAVQLAARPRQQHTDSSPVWLESWTRLEAACRAGDALAVQVALCSQVTVEDTGPDGRTALHHACLGGHAHLASLLLGLQAPVNCQDTWNQTPLHAACQGPYLSTVTLLLAAGCDVNLADKGGDTGLHLACKRGDKSMVQVLVQAGADVSLHGSGGHTAFVLACKHHHWDVAQLLIASCQVINEKLDGLIEGEPATVLLWACCAGDTQLVEFLLQHSAHTDIEHGEGQTALYASCYEGHVDIVQLLVKHGADIDVSTVSGVTPLIISCLKGHTDITQVLVCHRADVNKRCHDGFTALYAACYSGDVESVRTLVSHNADINVKNDKGVTPLHIACNSGDVESVRTLVSHNADINVKNDKGVTPLHIACRHGHTDIVRVLLTHDVDINVRNDDGCTPLYTACDAGNTNTACLLLQHDKTDVNILSEEHQISPLHLACYKGLTKVVGLLIARHAEVNVTDVYGNTPLHFACANGHCDIVRILVQNNADVHTPNNDGYTPLHKACVGSHSKVVDLPIAHSAAVDTPNKDGDTPLHMACVKGHSKVVDLLIAHNAAVDTPNKGGCTPLHMACVKGHSKVVELLITHNADVDTPSNGGHTPLHKTCARGHSKVIDLLIDNNNYHNEMEIGNTRPLVEDYFRYRLERNGLSWQNGQSSDVTPNETQNAMRALGDEFETRFSDQVNDFINQLHITTDTAPQTFRTIVNEIFSDGVNWGRIVALFEISGKLAVHCVQQSMPQLVNSLVDWVSTYVDRTLKAWLTENNGWAGFLEYYEGGPEQRSKESWPSFKNICSIAAAGLGILTLGAILAQKS